METLFAVSTSMVTKHSSGHQEVDNVGKAAPPSELRLFCHLWYLSEEPVALALYLTSLSPMASRNTITPVREEDGEKDAPANCNTVSGTLPTSLCTRKRQCDAAIVTEPTGNFSMVKRYTKVSGAARHRLLSLFEKPQMVSTPGLAKVKSKLPTRQALVLTTSLHHFWHVCKLRRN